MILSLMLAVLIGASGAVAEPRDTVATRRARATIDSRGLDPDQLTRIPRHEHYLRLRRAYDLYRVMTEWPVVSAGKALKKGQSTPRVAELRARLGLAPDESFDDGVEAAVRDFQRHHGLADDGVVGPVTLRELNVSRRQRVEQIASNLERMNTLPDDPGDLHLLVNVAAFQLDLVDCGVSRLSMRIVAGKRYTRTPTFSARVERVVINPPWNVPDGIAAKELWPKQRANPGYFAREHLRVVAGGRLRQDPGPWCALGRVKFDMPNRYNVYLHDTPARTLFARDLRAFSHGCMRVELPVELAVELTHRTHAEIEALIEEGHEKVLALDEPVPVHVVYWTAFVADDGHVEFRRDVYERDLVRGVTDAP